MSDGEGHGENGEPEGEGDSGEADAEGGISGGEHCAATQPPKTSQKLKNSAVARLVIAHGCDLLRRILKLRRKGTICGPKTRGRRDVANRLLLRRLGHATAVAKS